MKDAAELLYTIYSQLGNYQLALENKELYVLLKDSLLNRETQKATIKSQLKYDYEKKAAADNVKVLEEKKISELKLKQEQNQKHYIYVGLALITLFGLFMYTRFRTTKKQKAIIEQQKVVAEKQMEIVDLKQKEILESIHYAKRIQKALLPSEKYIKKKIQ
jgi:hypothetical protein